MKVDDFVVIEDSNHPHYKASGYICEIFPCGTRCDVYLNTIDKNTNVRFSQIRSEMIHSGNSVEETVLQIIDAMYKTDAVEWMRLLNIVRLNKDSRFTVRAVQRLAAHSQKIFDLTRTMNDVDLSKIRSSGLALLGPPEELQKFQIAMNGFCLLGMLFGETKVARKAAKSDLVDIYQKLILSPSLDSSSNALETIMHGASIIVTLPSIKNRNDHKNLVQRFFRDPKMKKRLRFIVQKRSGEFVATCAQRVLDMLSHTKDNRNWKKIQKSMYNVKKERTTYACSSKACDFLSTKYEDLKICGRCKLARYCSRKCQKYDWKHGHDKICKRLK